MVMKRSNYKRNEQSVLVVAEKCSKDFIHHFEVQKDIVFLSIRTQSVHIIHQLFIGIKKLWFRYNKWSTDAGIP